jgi:hypothetical protein
MKPFGCYCGRFRTDDESELKKLRRIIPGVYRCSECPATRTYLCIYRECRAHTIRPAVSLPHIWTPCPKCQNPAYSEAEPVHPRHLPMLRETLCLGLYGEIPPLQTAGPEWDALIQRALAGDFQRRYTDLTPTEAFAAACGLYQDLLLAVKGWTAVAR